MNLVRNYRRDLFVFVLFGLLVAVTARSVLGKMDQVILGDDPDTRLNLWTDWWAKKALSEPDTSLWYTDYLFYPEGAALAFHSFSHLNSLVSISLAPLFGTVPAYNITILLNFVLIGLATFQFAHYETRSTAAGILAALVLTFNSQVQYQASHPVLLSIWVLPWATLAFLRAVRQHSFVWAIVAALAILLTSLVSI